MVEEGFLCLATAQLVIVEMKRSNKVGLGASDSVNFKS